jgi:hypothetical protein
MYIIPGCKKSPNNIRYQTCIGCPHSADNFVITTTRPLFGQCCAWECCKRIPSEEAAQSFVRSKKDSPPGYDSKKKKLLLSRLSRQTQCESFNTTSHAYTRALFFGSCEWVCKCLSITYPKYIVNATLNNY